MAFHLRDGFYFERQDNGAVQIRVAESPRDGAPTDRSITVPANEWASVVAALSADGDNAEAYRAALDFHTGEGS